LPSKKSPALKKRRACQLNRKLIRHDAR
jgi:hypothetical protein